MFRVINLRSLNKNLVRFTTVNLQSLSNAHSAAPATSTVGHHDVYDQRANYPRIGNREIVGFGRNGEPQYFDSPDCPLPAIRWKEDTAELKALREKARGDWSKLTIDEKRALYRADFRVTIIETVSAEKGSWKFITGFVLILVGASIWAYYALTRLIYAYPKLETSSLEHQHRMLERMIAQGVGRVHGVSSEWDYEKGDWKKNTK